MNARDSCLIKGDTCAHMPRLRPHQRQGERREGGGREEKKEKERGPQLLPQIPNLIGSVISALLIDGYNPPESPEGRAGVLRVWEITRLTGVER